jgi:hypothetical protein
MRLPTSGKLMPCIADAIVELEKMMETANVIDNSFIDRYEAIRPRIPASKELQDEKKSNLIFQDKPVIRPEISAGVGYGCASLDRYKVRGAKSRARPRG